MNLTEVSLPPGSAHYFGTDTMGRDIYSMIWEGGRVSLYIGILATAISSVTAIVYGCVSGLVPDWLDDLLMRFTEIILSIPSILLVIFLQALLGEATATSIAVVIGLTSWMNISKVFWRPDWPAESFSTYCGNICFAILYPPPCS